MKYIKANIPWILLLVIFTVSLGLVFLKNMESVVDLRAQPAYPTLPPPPPANGTGAPTPVPVTINNSCASQGLAQGAACTGCNPNQGIVAYGCSTNSNGATGNCTASYSSWCACDNGGCYAYETINGCATAWVNDPGCLPNCPVGNSCVPHNSNCTPCDNSPNVCYTDVVPNCVPVCADQANHCPADIWQNSCGYNTCSGGTKPVGCSAYGSCSSCTPSCGQSSTKYAESICGGNCPPQACGNCAQDSCGKPSGPASCSPNSLVSSPTMVVTTTENLTWTDPSVPHAFTNWIVDVSQVGVATQNYSYLSSVHSMTTGVLVPGALYNWTVYPYDSNNCNGIAGSACTGLANNGIGGSLGGYFCYELTPGSVSMTSPIGTLANPIPFAGVTSTNLNWLNTEINHASFTDGYQVVVTNLDTGLVEYDNLSISQLIAKTTTFIPFNGIHNRYEWKIRAYNNQCDNVKDYGPWSYGYFSFNSLPTLTVLNMRNVVPGYLTTLQNGTVMMDGTLVATQTVSGIVPPVNQICQIDFQRQSGHERDVSFRINLNDLDGRTDLARTGIRLSNGATSLTVYVDNLGAATTSPAVLAISTGAQSADVVGKYSFFQGALVNWSAVNSSNLIVVVPVRFNANFPEGLYNLEIFAEDKYGAYIAGSDVNGWIDAGRDFKVWGCNVPVVGGVYDASSFSAFDISQCNPLIYMPANGYSRSLLSYIGFKNASVGITTSIFNNYQYQSTLGMGHLTWGNTYSPETNDTFDIPDAVNQMWVQDQEIGTGTCLTTLNITSLDVGKTFSGAQTVFMVSPYSNNPSVEVNFAAIRDQMQWYQVAGAGVLTNQDLNFGVPSTCDPLSSPPCYPALSINSSNVGASSGLVASGLSVVNRNGCDDTRCFYGYPSPERNWYTQTASVVPASFTRLLNDIYHTNGIGVTVTMTPLSSWSNVLTNVLGGTGIVFINGDLVIDNTTTVVNSPNYLVVIASGNITINQNVTQLDGIYLAGGSITAAGTNIQQLVINGSLHANGRITLSRTFPTVLGNPSLNNTKASVLINYRPENLFLIPQEVFYGLTNWSNN